MRLALKTLCVYCGSRLGKEGIYAEAAQAFGDLYGRMGFDFVFGAGSPGLMGTFAKAAMNQGAKVTGVIPHFLEHRESALQDLHEIIRTTTMAERKLIMADRADGFVVLPGGFGTLEEIAEIITLKQLSQHQKPIVFFNVAGYFDLLAHFFEHIISQGFADADHLQNFRLVNKVEAIYPALCEQIDPASDKFSA